MYGNIVLGTFDSYSKSVHKYIMQYVAIIWKNVFFSKENDDVENLQDESCDGNAQSPEKGSHIAICL